MTIKEAISPVLSSLAVSPTKWVDGSMPLTEALPRLLDTPDRLLGVVEDGERIGIVDQTSLLEGFGRMIAARDDCSVITVECVPADYSASRLAHAVEDSDAHLVDLWTVPSDEGMIKATLRVRRADPTATVHSLERYGYNVVEAHGSDYQDARTAFDRLLGLQALLNV